MKKIKLKESDIERLVNKIIKEEEDTSNDVAKFLELADKYLFQKFSNYAQKIDTNREKAQLIAALAEKWDVDTNELSRVKSVLSKSEEEGGMNEAYDDPGIMARHTGGYMGKLKMCLDTIIDNMVYLEHLLPEVMDKKLQTKLDNFLEMSSDPLEDLNDELDEADDRLMGRFKGWEN
jgi:hypothetical protein